MPRYALETILVILMLVWLMGWLVFPLNTNLIHVLLLLVLAVVGIRVAQGRREPAVPVSTPAP